MSASQPLVSVLIPAYNGERFIGEAIASVLVQTHRRLEILVGDDASTDGTADEAERSARGDARVTVIRREANVGAFRNPELLLEAARGDFIKFLLQDDVLAPTAIERLAAPMVADPAVVFATSKRGMIDERGARLPDAPHNHALVGHDAVFEGLQLGDKVLERLTNVLGEMSTVMFRNGVVEPEGLWMLEGRELRGNGDLALWLRLLARGRAFYTPEELSFFRQHGRQRSQDRSVLVGATTDWPFLIDGARALGFLAAERSERAALGSAIRAVSATLAEVIHDPEADALLETVYLTLGRLIEMRDDPDRRRHGDRVDRRLHADAFVARLAAPLDRRASSATPLARVDGTANGSGADGSDASAGHPEDRYPAAVAAPSLTEHAVAAAVQALRGVAEDATAGRCLAVVPVDRVDQAVPLFEAALAVGQDFDLELVPAADPGAVLERGWLAVVEAGVDSDWADGASGIRRYAVAAGG